MLVQSDSAEENAILASPPDFEGAVEFAPCGIVISDPSKSDNPLVYANSSFLELTRYRLDEVIGRNCRFLQGPQTDASVVTAIREAIIKKRQIRVEILNYRKDGQTFWTDLLIAPTASHFVGVLTDITARKQSERDRLEAETRLFNIVNNMPGYVFQRVQKKDGTITFPYFSPSFSRIIGLPHSQIATADDLWDHMHQIDIDNIERGIARSASDLSPLMIEFRLLSEAKEEQWIRTYSTPRRLTNGDIVWDGVGINVTAEKEVERRLVYLAHHDALTGLANRTFLSERLGAEIEVIRRDNSQIAMSHLLIVNLSEINETLGAEDGDAVLKGVAARLEELAACEDAAVAARIGSAEFALVRRGSAPDADTFAQMIQKQLAQPILVGREAIIAETNIGIAVFNSGDLPDLLPHAAAHELMKRAGLALSAAIKSGGGARRHYDEDIDHRRRHRMILRHSLRKAIETNQLELHYQPLVDLRSGKIVSAEALVRWHHPDLGLLRPDLFIPLAEESGLIDNLGAWVVRSAIRQSRAWEASGYKVPKIALNVSGVQVRSGDFVNTIRDIVEETGGDPKHFELELTEGILLEQSPETLSTLLALKLMGFRIAIDDFGAGHASFQYLRGFPIDKLKIDRIFVQQLRVDSADAMIIQAIASLARGLKVEIVAEGIETAEQRDFLRDQGCAIGQGYFFSMPLSAEDFGWMIENEISLPFRSMEPRK